MDDNNLQYMASLNDSSSSFELPQDPSPASMPCKLPKKPRQPQQPKGSKTRIERPQHSDDIPGAISLEWSVIFSDAPSAGVYSKKLKRIYTSTNQTLRVCFTWLPTFQPLYLRSAILFVEDYHIATPVQRCYAHRGPELPQNAGVSYDQLRYIFRISDPANIYESSYETDINGILTTKTALRADEGKAWLDYNFFCQNSCPTGISRRATKMVFLAEDAMGLVIAKRSVFIQICSNPKRDKERDENRILSKSMLSKRKKPSQPPLPPNDSENNCDENETVYTLNVDILGQENYKAVLQYAYGIMAAQAFRTGNHQLVKPHMDAILKKECEE